MELISMSWRKQEWFVLGFSSQKQSWSLWSYLGSCCSAVHFSMAMGWLCKWKSVLTLVVTGATLCQVATNPVWGYTKALLMYGIHGQVSRCLFSQQDCYWLNGDLTEFECVFYLMHKGSFSEPKHMGAESRRKNVTPGETVSHPMLTVHPPIWEKISECALMKQVFRTL